MNLQNNAKIGKTNHISNLNTVQQEMYECWQCRNTKY